MSVQFGRWDFGGRPVDPEYVDKVDALLAPYGPDGCSSHSIPGTTILYHAFHTTKESRREKQPHISNSGAVITWDGRLDNRGELIRELIDVVTIDSTDVEIVAAAYEEWGEKFFAKLTGDWAIAIWNPTIRSLTLAKDVIGTRHLYYAVEESGITWSTILDPLVLLAGRKFQLCEEYIAGWLGFFPATHLTPYIGIDSVPPSSFVRLQPGKREMKQYWDFDPQKRIRYRTDAEYEEHFRVVFGEAVRRRLRSDSPVLAELSGGMDSSSIVCMADEIIARGMAETPRLDTISYYDDSEPNWSERAFFSKIEEKRGRKGCHIDVAGREWFTFEVHKMFVGTPSATGETANPRFATLVMTTGSRTVLSGVGGDEVTGGVPTPISELQDLFCTFDFPRLPRQLKFWAVAKKRPWLQLITEALQGFLPSTTTSGKKALTPWLTDGFTKRNAVILAGYRSRLKVFGALPSFQQNVATINALRRQLGCSVPTSQVPHEKRYPYLDTGLLQFLFAVPRDQLVRPHQRRSLMRRALSTIVPVEILTRSRKAFVRRAPIADLRSNFERVIEITTDMVSSSLRIVDPDAFCNALRRSRDGEEVPIGGILRTLGVEVWARSLRDQGVLKHEDRPSISGFTRVRQA